MVDAPEELRLALPRACDVILEGMGKLHIGAQVYVSLKGRVVADEGFGEARIGVPMTRDTVMLWMSAVKPVAGVAMAKLWEQGKIHWGDPVALHIPEFAANGKAGVTIYHLLTHTGGFPAAAAGRRDASWDEMVRAICAAPLEPGWVPGQKAGYHMASSWIVLGEIVRRVDGRDYGRYVREEVFLPIGMDDSWIGMPLELYRSLGDRLGILHDTKGRAPKPVAWDPEEEGIHYRPGKSGRGPIRELGWFYEMLLEGGRRNGVRLIGPQTVELLTSRHRAGMFDETFRHLLDWGFGFIIDSNRHGAETVPYGYGRHCSPRTYGHGGFQGTAGFADPEHGLAVAWVMNGLPGERRHTERAREINSAIYRDLGLA